jgi:ATP-dependent exoDNAse (exonuclease V) alpha subunit
VDEISMIGREKLHDMHIKLGYNLGDNGNDHIFGNRSLLFAGDFQQLPPVGDICLLSKLPNHPKNVYGNIVFNNITHYFELTHQKRQDDTEYLQVLRNIRNCTVTDADFEFLKLHCKLDVDFDNLTIQQTVSLLETKIIVSENMKRIRWNQILSKKYAHYHKKPLHICNAIDEVHEYLTMQMKEDLKWKLLNQLQPTLHLVIGMPVVILKNLYKYLRVNNGSDGILRDVVYDSSDKVIALQIEILDGDFQVDPLPKNHIYVKREGTTGNFKFGTATIPWRRAQFPISEGFCLTDYKVQGATLQRAIVDLKSSRGVSTYVKLSRTKNRATTKIMEGFTKENLNITVPAGYLV